MFDQDFKKRQKGTGFTNIGKITQANVGAGQQMAGKIAQGIQTAGQNAQNKLGQAQQQFKTGFQKATQPVMNTFQQTGGIVKRPDESEEDYAKRIAGAQQTQPSQTTAQPGSPVGNQAGNQPAATPIDYAEIGKQLRDVQYTGPKGLENDQRLISGAVSAGQLGGMTTSNLGQQELLKQFIAGRQGYTKGQGSLDAMLMGQSSEGQRQLQQARQSVSSLPEDVLSSIKSSQSQATAMGKGIEKEKSRILGGVQSSVEELEKRAQEKAQLYSQDASRLAELMGGGFSNIGFKKGDKGTEYSEAQAAKDKDLMRRAEEFGLGGDVDIETLSPEDYQKVMQELASGATTKFTSKYGDPQKAALEKLAKFQQDETRAQEIKNVKDKKAFQTSSEDLKNLKSIKDIEASKDLDKKAISKDMPKLQQVANARGTVSHLDYMGMAESVLGRDVVQSIRNKMDEENGRHDWFGASDEYIDSVTDGEIQRLIQEKLQPMYEAQERLGKREKNKVSLKDYIKRFS